MVCDYKFVVNVKIKLNLKFLFKSVKVISLYWKLPSTLRGSNLSLPVSFIEYQTLQENGVSLLLVPMLKIK